MVGAMCSGTPWPFIGDETGVAKNAKLSLLGMMEETPFTIMASQLEKISGYFEEAAKHSQTHLYRPEMDFAELREHLAELARLYRQELAYKAFATHRRFSVKNFSKRKARPEITAERRQQLREAGRKGGSKKGSKKKTEACRDNANKRWRGC